MCAGMGGTPDRELPAFCIHYRRNLYTSIECSKSKPIDTDITTSMLSLRCQVVNTKNKLIVGT
jgi:hypothetical protein